MGTCATSSSFRKEGIAYADIDHEDIIDYKYGIDAAVHYRNQYLTMNCYRKAHPFCNYNGDGKQEPIPYDALLTRNH